MKLCCAECFDDRGLRKNIIPTLDPQSGTCGYCKSSTETLIEPRKLLNYFELLIAVYDPDPNGKTLDEWMKSDWEMFSHENMDDARTKVLLGEILDDGNVMRQTFSPSPAYESQGLIDWETLRDEMMYKNRWFMDKPLDTDRLKDLLDHLPFDDPPEVWFRARIQTEDVKFPIEKMGAPPKRISTHGRANPPGIPYLYLGSTPETATAELRPHTGEIACVADFRISGPLNAIDLRAPRKLVSPFLLADAEAIGQLRADLPFLERLGEELTRPVLPRGAAIDYIPSQYLCELIKKTGRDGVVYRSSVSDGINLALFNPEKAHGGAVALYDITRVSVAVRQLTN